MFNERPLLIRILWYHDIVGLPIKSRRTTESEQKLHLESWLMAFGCCLLTRRHFFVLSGTHIFLPGVDRDNTPTDRVGRARRMLPTKDVSLHPKGSLAIIIYWKVGKGGDSGFYMDVFIHELSSIASVVWKREKRCQFSLVKY